nr:DUF1698 domain-containing protein [Sedimentisphaera salicampi]
MTGTYENLPPKSGKTDWMSFESLDDFLDPQDKTKTIEGHQAPIRAAFTASK